MEVDNTGNSDSAAAQRIAQKRLQQELEEQKVQLEIGRAQRDREKVIATEKEKTDRQLVEISQQASNQMDVSRKFNSDRVRAVNENQQQHFDALAQKTATDLKRLDTEAAKTIEAHKFGTMEKIKSVTDRAEDPFYRLKSLDPVLTENESAYVIAVRLPPHEADNLFVSGEGPYLKLSLARRYQDNAKSEAGDRSTKTSSYQSVVEQIAMPGPYEARKIERKYENGVVSITVPKQIFRQTIT